MHSAIAEQAARARAAEAGGQRAQAVDLWRALADGSDEVRWALRLAIALSLADRDTEAEPLYQAAAERARGAGAHTAALVAWLAGDLPGAAEAFAGAPLPLLGALTADAFATLLPSLSRRALAPGEVLIREGTPAQAVYLLAEGEVEVVRRDEKAGEFRLGVLSAGAVIGEMALILDHPRSASVRALSECELLRIEIDGLKAARESTPAIGEALTRFTQRRLLNAVVGSSPLLRGVPPEGRDALIEEFVTLQAPAGTVLVEEGQPTDGIYVIVSGSATVARRDGAREVGLAELGPGQVFGEIGLLGGGLATATVTASVDTELRCLDAAAFAALCDAHPAVREQLTRLSEARLAEIRFIFDDDEFIEAAD